jgi:hypothetical protein
MSNLTATSSSDFSLGSSRPSARAVARSVIFILAGLAMLAAAVILFVAERDTGVSLPVWNVARVVCQGVTGLLGLRMLASLVLARGWRAGFRQNLSTVGWGVALVVAAVIGANLVFVVTGLAGIGLILAGVVNIVYVGSARPTR